MQIFIEYLSCYIYYIYSNKYSNNKNIILSFLPKNFTNLKETIHRLLIYNNDLMILSLGATAMALTFEDESTLYVKNNCASEENCWNSAVHALQIIFVYLDIVSSFKNYVDPLEKYFIKNLFIAMGKRFNRNSGRRRKPLSKKFSARQKRLVLKHQTCLIFFKSFLTLFFF